MRAMRVVVGIFALVVLAASCSSEPAATRSASGATSPEPGVLVSMGDSYIAGTGGRWKGNSNGATNLPLNLDAFRRTDTGDNAYDNYGLSFPGEECFRSRSAAVHLGGQYSSINIACSNARTYSRIDEEKKYKPGIDAGGQLDELAKIAVNQRVALVAVSIGANNFRFGPVMQSCVTSFLTSLSMSPRLCSQNPEVLATVEPAGVAQVRNEIVEALSGIITTMRAAGYADGDWQLLSHTYPNPLPSSSLMRHPQAGLSRQTDGGCPFYDADIDWLSRWMDTMNATVIDAASVVSSTTGKNVLTLEMGGLFEGRRLCEKGTRLAEETSDEVELVTFGERVAQINLSSSVPGSPYKLSEGVHPNQLGQLAIRSCLRNAFAEGNARSGVCRPPSDWSVADSRGEPRVVFTPK